MRDQATANPPEVSDERLRPIPGAGRLGMWVLIASLTMLFGASIIAYMVVRMRSPEWPPPGTKLTSAGLWISTLVIAFSSLTQQLAFDGIKRGDVPALKRYLAITYVFGLVFLGFQTFNWFDMVGYQAAGAHNLFAFTFYMLTGLHALHVFGGILPMTVVLVKAFKGRYKADYYPGPLYSTMYWHFLTVMWFVIFAILFIGSVGTGSTLPPPEGAI